MWYERNKLDCGVELNIEVHSVKLRAPLDSFSSHPLPSSRVFGYYGSPFLLSIGMKLPLFASK